MIGHIQIKYSCLWSQAHYSDLQPHKCHIKWLVLDDKFAKENHFIAIEGGSAYNSALYIASAQ